MLWLTRISLRHPTACLLLIGVVTVGLGLGIPELRTEYGYRVLIGDDHPSIRALDDFIAEFGGGLPMSVAWECGPGRPCKSALDESSILMAADVTSKLSHADLVQRVSGIANAPVLVPSPGGFRIRAFHQDGQIAPDVDELAKYVLRDPLWTGSLVSRDGSAGAIIVQPVDTRSETDTIVANAIFVAIEPWQRRGFEYHFAGEGLIGLISGADLAASTGRLIPVTVAAIALVLFWLSGSLAAVGLSLLAMMLALIWTFGLLGWLDWPQDGILEVLAPLILVVGICDAVHLVSRFAAELSLLQETTKVENRDSAMLTAVVDIAPPCALTTITTAAAFFSFTTSEIDTFVRFGVISAFGVLACYLSTFTFLPILATRLPGRSRPESRTPRVWSSALSGLVVLTRSRARLILAASALLVGGCGWGWVAHVEVNTDWYESFGESSRVVQAIRFMEQRLGQSQTLEVRVSLSGRDEIHRPDVLKRIEAFAQFVSHLEGMGAASSVLDLIRQVNRMLHDDLPEFARLGKTEAANAEIVELIAFDGTHALESWMSLDRSHIRLSIEAAELSYLARFRLLESVGAYARRELPPGWRVLLSGPVAMGFDWIRDVQRTQLRSFPTAFVLVFVLVWMFFRSLTLALAAMVPTLLPVVVTLGAMGWAGMTLDVGRAMIAAIMIGIAVDDAIHLLNHYRVRRAGGDAPGDAMTRAILHTGRAVVTTSLALSLGFLTLMMSAWQTISSFGFFVSLSILAALAAALLVLPALIFVLCGEGGEGGG